MNAPAPKVFHQVTIVETGEVYRCREDETLLAGMERLGKRGIPVGCRGGGCGVCKVQVEAGEYSKRVMSRAYVSAEEEAATQRMLKSLPRTPVLPCRHSAT